MAESNIYTLLTKMSEYKLTFAEELHSAIIDPKKESLIKYLPALAIGISKHRGIFSFHEEAINFLKSENMSYIKAGLMIASNIDYTDHGDLSQAMYKVVDTFLNSSDDNIKYNATQATIALSKFVSSADEKITEISAKEEIAFRLPLADFIWRQKTTEKPTERQKQLAFNLVSFKSDHAGFINFINWHIVDAYTNGDREYSFALFESWMKTGQDPNSMNHCLSKFMSKDFKWFCKSITPWFKSSDANLMSALMNITSKDARNVFKLDSEILNSYTDMDLIRIIGAIMGFIYMKEPLASLTLSILDSDHFNSQSSNIETLFVDYICYTYPSTLKDFIKPAHKISTANKKKVLQRIVKRVDKYYNDLSNLPNLKELTPSDERSRNYNKAFKKRRSKEMDKARKEDVFQNLAKNIVMRSGPIWFCKTKEGYSKESRLQQMDYSFEMPRAEYIDPATFEIFRTRMRFEAMKR